MSRPKKPARLVLLEREGRKVYVIRDGTKFVRTGHVEGEHRQAEEKLAAYFAKSHNPAPANSDGAGVIIGDVLMAYRDHKFPPETRPDDHKAKSPELRLFESVIDRLNDFWGELSPSDVLGPKCREFTKKRGTDSGARRDLAILNAALNFYRKEYGLKAETSVTLPPKGMSRDRCLTRDEAAKLLWTCYRDTSEKQKHKRKHLVRFILIALYTASRHRAILNLQWHENDVGGHVDIDKGVLYRRSRKEIDTKKRRPPIRIPKRLMAHLERWKRLDKGLTHVVHYQGQPIDRLESSFRRAREDANLDNEVVPHILRHSSVTWMMRAGVPIHQIAGFAGMTIEMIEQVYGHHHPDHQDAIATTRLIGARKPARKQQAT